MEKLRLHSTLYDRLMKECQYARQVVFHISYASFFIQWTAFLFVRVRGGTQGVPGSVKSLRPRSSDIGYNLRATSLRIAAQKTGVHRSVFSITCPSRSYALQFQLCADKTAPSTSIHVRNHGTVGCYMLFVARKSDFDLFLVECLARWC